MDSPLPGQTRFLTRSASLYFAESWLLPLQGWWHACTHWWPWHRGRMTSRHFRHRIHPCALDSTIGEYLRHAGRHMLWSMDHAVNLQNDNERQWTTMHSGSCNIIIRLCSFTSEVCWISVRNSRSDTAEIVSLQCSPLLVCKGKPIAPESRNGPASRAKGKVLSTNRKHNPEHQIHIDTPALPCDRPANMHAFDKRFEHLWCCCCPGHCYVSSSHVLSGSAAGQ